MTDDTWPEHAARLDAMCDGRPWEFTPADIATLLAVRDRLAELESTIQAMADENSVGNPAWLAMRMRERAEIAETKLAALAWQPIATCPTDERMVEINARIGFLVLPAREASVRGWLATHWRPHTPPTTTEGETR